MIPTPKTLCYALVAVAIAGCQPVNTVNVSGTPPVSGANLPANADTTVAGEHSAPIPDNTPTEVVTETTAKPILEPVIDTPTDTNPTSDDVIDLAMVSPETIAPETSEPPIITEAGDDAVVTEPEVKATIIVPPIPIKPPAGPRQIYPALLLGETAQALQDALGTADRVRTEGQMQIWQYYAAACVLDFYLYPGDDTLVIAHYHSRNPIFEAVLNSYQCQVQLGARTAQ